MLADKRKRSVIDIINEHIEEFEQWLNQFEETLTEKPSWSKKNSAIEPLKNMAVHPKEVTITVDLPFTKENTLQVKPLDENTLEISASTKRKIRLNELGITNQEGEIQKFHCHARLPVPVQMDKMEIRFKKGILEIRLPRKHETRKLEQ